MTDQELETIRVAAHRIVAGALETDLRLSDPEILGGERERNRITRWRVQGPVGVPATVICKESRGAEDDGMTELRFRNEIAAAEFLSRLSLDPPVSPRFYGSDRALQILVLEDMGDGLSLADTLTGSDASAAEAALYAYARALGRVNAAGIGRAGEYAAIRGTSVAGAAMYLVSPEREAALRRDFPDACETLGIAIHGFDREAEGVASRLSNPGPFLTVNVSDACPDNHVLSGDTARFFDFEFSGLGHALLEGSYLRLPFPTCWCVARLPDAIQQRAEDLYRSELAETCPAAGNDDLYGQAMLDACTYWTLSTVSWTLKRSLDADMTWGLITHRQRHGFRLERLLAQIGASNQLPATTRIAREMLHILRTRWHDEDLEVPLYPAFA